MKTKFKFLLAFLTLAIVTTTSAQLGDPNKVMNYGATGDGSYFSIGGTNGAAGYTNTPVFVNTPGATVSVLISAKGYSANLSNAMTFVVSPAYSSATADTATTNTTRYSVQPQGNTTLITNLTLTGWSAPGMKVSLENPASNPVSVTNLTVRVTTKNR